jgi:hypothetical protein
VSESDGNFDRRMIIDAEWKAETTQSLRTIIEAIKGPPNRYEDGMEHKVNSLMGEWAMRKATRQTVNTMLAMAGAFTAGITAMWIAFHDAIIAFFKGLK